MPSLVFGSKAYRRNVGSLPELKLVNFFPEAAPTAEQGVILQSRPGLVSSYEVGDGPIKGIFSKPGLYDGDKFSISDNVLYREQTEIGPITGNGITRWAASDTELVVTRDGAAYSYNGTDLQAISFPDGANVTDVAYIASLFVFVRAGTQKFYWSSVLDARSINALDFASAELVPDILRGVISLNGRIYFCGEESIEPWFPSGNPDLPFTRIDQNLIAKGIYQAGAVTEFDNTIAFVGGDGVVYRLGGGPERISDHGIEERIRTSNQAFVQTFVYEGHTHLIVHNSTGTLVYDAATQAWWEAASYGHPNFRGYVVTNVGDQPYFGDAETADIWTFGDTFTDGGEPLEGYFSAVTPISGTQVFDSIEVHTNAGRTDPLVGDDADPVMEMRSSRDAGATFSNWREASLGAQGKYRTRVVWRRCGLFDAPGACFEFRTTDQSPRRISAVKFNEPDGGRLRG